MNAVSPEITAAAEHLRAGRLVAFPTETVYGLGADAANAEAVDRLYAVKGRPGDHPVIVHVASAAALDTLATDVPPWARALTDAYWPGPLTLVVRRAGAAVCDAVTGGRDTVGVRVPDHPVALELLRAFGGGVAAPSANRFGRVSPTTAEHVRRDLGDDIAQVLDGGACRVGVESTIVDATGALPVVLRFGAVTAADIERVTGIAAGRSTEGAVAAPGTLAHHYAPDATVEVVVAADLQRIVRAHCAAGRRVGVLASSSVVAADPDCFDDDVTVLDRPDDTESFAHVLYARLREADVLGLDVLVVVAPDGDGLAAAVADRLRRAATVRP